MIVGNKRSFLYMVLDWPRYKQELSCLASVEIVPSQVAGLRKTARFLHRPVILSR